MILGWTRTRLGEVVKIKHGFAFSGMGENADWTLPVVVAIGNFDYAGGFRFGSTKVKRYVGDFPAEFRLRPGDVLLAMTCQTPGGEILGIPGTVPDDGQVYLHNQRLGKVEVLDPKRIDLKFVFQLARWEPFNRYLFSTASGSKILHTSPGRIEDFTLDLPPVEEQREIAAILGNLDDRIESNQRAASMAMELAGLLLTDGGEQERLGDIAQLDKGLSYKGAGLDDGATPGALPMLNLASFTTGSMMNAGGIKHYTGTFRPRHRLAAGELVVANTDLTQNREILGRVLLVPPTLDGSLHTHHTSHLRFERRPELKLVAWAQLQSPQFRTRAKGFATGTTVTALPPEAVLDFRISVPSDLESTLMQSSLLIERAWMLEEETARLKVLRAALLAALMSGQLRLSAEDAVSWQA
ncbi:type I restriction enzyme S subunit [Microbacterium testaceum]|uniref:restriction endonuclease subunit S n=1 Tax=Microbacterium testaceum TaxID=2033 RepID=UPI00277F4361|nr:restriction endonuclease subunit S [Microbacterium testaceum]MDQ1175162.1 type I restriction enzyme S subunit [Microbacterium testaceum]